MYHPAPDLPDIPLRRVSQYCQPPSACATEVAATPALDLATTLSSLDQLLCLSTQVLDSISSLISLDIAAQNAQNDDLVPCPHNHHHSMPPEHLFKHSIRCPTPPPADVDFLIDSLNYPKTLNPPETPKNLFTQTIDDIKTELCFSLDDYYDESGSNFFYKDLPGVVSLNDLDRSERTFVLPGILSLECGNFVASSEGKITSVEEHVFPLFPSDIWLARREISEWNDHPSAYSCGVSRAIWSLNMIKTSDLKQFIIVNSTSHGVVIDVYMRDHICVLFTICLKAIRREASSLQGSEISMKTLRFTCPILVQVLQWVASQLSVLYGEHNAKFFSIHVLKKCLLKALNVAVLFPLECNLNGSSGELAADGDGIRGVKFVESCKSSGDSKLAEVPPANSIDGNVIFVHQIAAAIAALHERSMLEAKLIALRAFGPLPRLELLAAYDYLSKKADEERKSRPDYRAIIQHDGILQKRSCSQETSKTLTNKDILAEERDYKRRRMSYRGKKLKRSNLEVMRDIIDEYMHEIKKAGGMGFINEALVEDGMSLNSSVSNNSTLDSARLNKHVSGLVDHSSSICKSSNSSAIKHLSCQNMKQFERSHHVEYSRNGNKEDSHGKECHSRIAHKSRHHGQSHRQSSHYKDRNVAHARGSCWKNNSYYVPKNRFDDRYDPRDSQDYDDDDYMKNKLIKAKLLRG